MRGRSGATTAFPGRPTITSGSSARPPNSAIRSASPRPVLTGFVYSDNARVASTLAPDERKRLFLGEIARRFGPKALAPEHYRRFQLVDRPVDTALLTGFLTPGATALLGPAMRAPVGPIRWAGTETATHWPSFIDGAIRSGEREAAAIKA